MVNRILTSIAVPLLGLALIFSGEAWAGNSPQDSRDCFARHLDEALHLNRTRRSLYFHLTQGESLAISNRLIFLETLARFGNLFTRFDQRARPYHDAGIPMMCEVFVSMDLTPSFRERYEQGAPNPEDYRKPDGWSLSRKLRRALREEGLHGYSIAATLELERLGSLPQFHCMLRHVLESSIRIANLASEHERRASAKGLPSPARLSKDLVSSHLLTLQDVIDLDELAVPVQARGVPILCQDVPPIPLM